MRVAEQSGKNKVYTQRAVLAWQMNGTGSIDEDGVWQYTGPDRDPGPLNGSNYGNTSWTATTAGTPVPDPIRTDKVLNELVWSLAGQPWNVTYVDVSVEENP